MLVFSCWSTTVGKFYGRSLQGFGYGDVVPPFEKRCNLLGIHYSYTFVVTSVVDGPIIGLGESAICECDSEIFKLSSGSNGKTTGRSAPFTTTPKNLGPD